MYNSTKARLVGAGLSLLTTLLATPACAADFFGTPNIATGLGPVTANFKGQAFVNQGMVGAGRLAATSKDFRGDTLGSFSGMALDLSTWRRSGSGYAGKLLTLPDRGYNLGATIDDFTNYPSRINAFNLSFTPYSGGTLPQAPTSQNQVTLAYDAAASFLLRDFNGNVTTGEDPAASTTVQSGYTLPMVAAGREGAGRISVDAESLMLRRDGSFYVGDEYTGGLYYFDKTGKMAGYIAPPAAVLPRSGGAVNFTSFAQPSTSGRRNNQGLEGASLSADGKTLIAVEQSSMVQDSTSNQATRLNTRVFVYDVSANATPTSPTGHYVVQLPTFDKDGVGGAADRTAAQSEILALNNTQFLMLSRDGNGLDNGNSDPIMFKSVYLVDVAGATNLAGTAFETTAQPVSPNGALSATITPVQTIQFVNMLNRDQLTRFGLNVDADPSSLLRQNNAMTLSEKWEAMALAPVLEENAPQDFFLFVGNDNDFKTRTGTMVGDAQYSSYDAGVENDSMLLVYRVTLPTYVDPTYRAALEGTTPVTLGVLGAGADAVSQENSINIADHLDTLRRLRLTGGENELPESGFGFWGGLGYSTLNSDDNLSTDLADFTAGVGYHLNPDVELGLAVGVQGGEGDGAAFSYDYHALKVSAYAGLDRDGFFANASYTYGSLTFDDIARPAGYGQTATGDTDGDSHNLRVELGKLFDFAGMKLGPVAGARYLNSTLDGYSESGASGGNITYGEIEIENHNYFVGAEALKALGSMAGAARLTYNFNDNSADGEARLTSAQSVAGQITAKAPDTSEDSVAAALSLAGGHGKMAWHVGYKADVGVDSNDVEHRVFTGLSMNF